jgi:hypothetical protein
LQSFSVADLQRRLKFALDKVGVGNAIGGIDFSFNEDRNGHYQLFWCPHAYLIFATDRRCKIRKALRKLRQFKKSVPVPKPIKISKFNNNPRRRSYALKMTFKRRIGYDEVKILKDGKTRKCRNTSTDRLRAVERVELFLYLDEIGLAQRVVFRGGKPLISTETVRIKAVGRRIKQKPKNRK